MKEKIFRAESADNYPTVESTLVGSENLKKGKRICKTIVKCALKGL